jgi:hypothetical protein
VSPRLLRRSLVLTSAALASVTGLAAPAPAPAHAHTSTNVAACSGGSLTLYLDEEKGDAISGSGTLSGCSARSNPKIHSATRTVSGHATLRAPGLLRLTTTDRITWNTGQATTVTVRRTVKGHRSVKDFGTGKTRSGLFHPAKETELGTGIRTDSPTGIAVWIDIDADWFE